MDSNKHKQSSNVIHKIISFALFFFSLTGNVFAVTLTFEMGQQNYTEQGDKFIAPESVQKVELAAVLSEPLLKEVSFTYELFAAGTTATRFSDFRYNVDDDPAQRTNRVTVTFKTGEIKLRIPIVILNDNIKESDETIRFRMTMLSQAASLQNNDIYIEISDDEIAPIIVLSVEGEKRDSIDEISAAIDEGAGIQLTLENIANKSDRDIEVTYEITYIPAPAIGEENDYRTISGARLIVDPSNAKIGIEKGILTIKALETDYDFSLFIDFDSTPEGPESLKFELISANNGAVVHSPVDPNTSGKGPQTILNLTINDMDGNAGAINDTGVTRCYDDRKEIIPGCNSLEYPDQDGVSSDADRLDRYVKLNDNGDQLDDTATEWACVLDENTNLVWQVKASSTNFNVGDTSTYTWYNPIEHINGGNEGFTGGGGLGVDETVEQTCESSICNTSAYLSRTLSICGKGNWRIPNVNELLSIINFQRDEDDSKLVINNTAYFRHTLPRFYWTSTPASVNNESAWCIYFGETLKNHARLCEKERKYLVRLVKNYNPS